MPCCILRYCKNSNRNVNKSMGISFHRFVKADHEKHEEWLKFVQNERSEDTWLPSGQTHICSAHFQEKDFYITKAGRRYLKKDAVPKSDFIININSRLSSPSSLARVVVSDTDSIFDSPRKIRLKKQLKKATDHNRLIKKRCENIVRRNKLLNKKINKLTEVIKTFKEKFGLDSKVEKIILDKAELVEVLKNTFNFSKKRIYSANIKKFALTCHYYSPAAYKYVRTFFQNSLPHPRTISQWYNSVNAEPGFTGEAFRALKVKSESSEKPVICNLVFDEIAIRKQKLFKKRKLGEVNFGNCLVDSQKEEPATQALVLMLVSLTENWKIPVGYFLAAGISAKTKAALVTTCLYKCNEVGVHISSVTFDGCKSNIKAAEKLGCNFSDLENIKSSFLHPCTSEEVFIFLDPCHFIKLIRNTFESKRVLYDSSGTIRWELLANLNKLQQSTGLKFGNKISPRHLHFRNQIMKVKLATQLLSKSVADALKLCEQELVSSKFLNAASTINFITMMNNLFDVFNSRNGNFYGFRRPLDDKNKSKIFDFLNRVEQYILNLHIHIKQKRTIRSPNKEPRIILKIIKKRIVETGSNTGFVGALICINSLKNLFTKLVETKRLKYISTYRFSQDHLELFFGCIRRHNGNNNNPNVLQFRSAYKKILNHLELRSSFTGNCIPLDNFPILTTSAIQVINSTTTLSRHNEEDFQVLENELVLDTDLQADVNCAIFVNHLKRDNLTRSELDDSFTSVKLIVGYISGYVSRKLTKILKCEECVGSLTVDTRLWHHKLIVIKDMGGLCYSSKDVYDVCFKTEQFIRILIKEKGRDGSLPAKYSHIDQIVSGALKTFINSFVFENLTEHSLQQPGTLNHRLHLIRAIIEKYCKVRLHHESKVDPEIAHQTKRQKFNKLVLFEGN